MKSVSWWVVAWGMVLMLNPVAHHVDAACDEWLWQNPKPQGNDLVSVAYGDGMYVAVGAQGTITVSDDGQSWEIVPPLTDEDLTGVTWGNGRFVAVGYRGVVLTSINGLDWVNVEVETIRDLLAIAWDGSQFLIVSESWVVVTSPDGVEWTVTEVAVMRPVAVAGGDGVYIAVEEDAILRSTDAIEWTEVAESPNDSFRDVTWTGSAFFAVGEGGLIWTSATGETWSEQDSGTSRALYAILYANKRFVAVGRTGLVLSSADGVDWERWDSPFNLSLLGLTHGEEGFVAVGVSGAVATSPFARDWTAVSSYEPRDTIADLAVLGNTWVAVTGDAPQKAGNSKYYHSSDGSHWQSANSEIAGVARALACGENDCVAVGDGWIQRSVDGSDWTIALEDESVVFAGVRWTRDRYVAVGYDQLTRDAEIWESFDGDQWFDQSPAQGPSLSDVAVNDFMWVAVGAGGSVLWSPDSQHWNEVAATSSRSFFGVTWTGDRFVAVGERTLVMTSVDGRHWVERPVPEAGVVNLHDVEMLYSEVVAVGTDGTVLVSRDGNDWQLARFPTRAGLNAAVFDGRRVLVAGDDGMIAANLCRPPYRRPTGRIR